MKGKQTKISSSIFIGLILAFFIFGAITALADPGAQAPTLISYQGFLTDSNGDPMTGTVNLQFDLYATETGGSPLWSETQTGVPVSDGYFSVMLGSETPLSASDFSASERWLKVTVDGTAMPRQQFASVPYALQAENAATSASVPWSGITGMPADFADGVDDVGTGSTGWSLTGNGGTTNAVLGTTDAQTLTLVVNNTTAMRFNPGIDNTGMGPNIPNIIGGYEQNSVADGVFGAVIGGGGGDDFGSPAPNRATDSFATISGGKGNTANGSYATISGGGYNTITGTYTSIGGGSSNVAYGSHATISGGGYNATGNNNYPTVGGGYANISGNSFATVAGGRENWAYGDYAFIGSGQSNKINSNYGAIGGGQSNNIGFGQYATIGGGNSNATNGDYAAIGGGMTNTIHSEYSFIGGGNINTIAVAGTYATIGGGYSNVISGTSATIGGGSRNTAANSGSAIGGGSNNTASNTYTTISGGANNTAPGYAATVGGGTNNHAGTADGDRNAVIGGGDHNSITGGYDSTIGGGGYNQITAHHSTIGGGMSNLSQGQYGTIGGGQSNVISATYSTIPGGYRAQTTHYGEMAYASGGFAAAGDAQATTYVLRGTTTDQGGNYYLYLDGDNASESITIVPQHIMFFDIQVVAIEHDNNYSAGYHFSGVIKNTFNNQVSFINATSPLSPDFTAEDASASSWNVEVEADNTSDRLMIHVYGATGQTIRWVATVRATEVEF